MKLWRTVNEIFLARSEIFSFSAPRWRENQSWFFGDVRRGSRASLVFMRLRGRCENPRGQAAARWVRVIPHV